MSILCLNCRGLGDPEAVGKLRSLLRSSSPDIVFLSETKKHSDEMRLLWVGLGDFNCFAVGSVGRAGGLALLWKKELSVNVISYSLHHIDVNLEAGKDEDCWRFTGIYGWAEGGDKFRTGEMMRDCNTHP